MVVGHAYSKNLDVDGWMEDIDYPSLICDEWMLSLASSPGLERS